MRWFCWHDWSKWQTYVWQGALFDYRACKELPIQKTKQARVCSKCGKEIHRVVVDANGGFHSWSKDEEPPRKVA